MKKNIILGFLLTVLMVVGMNAQDKDSKPTEAKHECKDDACKHSHSFAPQKGDFTAAMLFGRGAYIGSSFSVPSSYSGSTVNGGAPYVGDISANSNSVTNMIGGEFRYYVGNKTALKFSGGAILRNTPYVVNTPGVYDNVNDVWIIPNYSHVDATEHADVNLSIGAEFLLKSKNDRLVPYVGFNLPMDYARRSVFTPPLIDDHGNVSLPDTGARHIEITALGIQAVAGADYYLAKDFFLGFDIKPVSYTYAYGIKSPAPEFDNLEAENSTVSFFAQFSFKLGFKF